MSASTAYVPHRPILGGATTRKRSLAPCPAPSLLPKSIRDTFAEVEKHAARAHALSRDMQELSDSIPGIRAREAQHVADLARAGDSSVPDSEVPAVETKIEQLRAERDGVQIAERGALAEALALLADERDPIMAKAEAGYDAALGEAFDAARVLASSFAAVVEAVQARRWVEAVSRGEHPAQAKVAFSTSLTQKNGKPYEVGEALAGIIASLGEYADQRAAAADLEA